MTMSEDLSSKTCLVYDTNGANVETARRLAKDFGRVLYSCNFHRGFDRLPEAAPGMGIEEIEWVNDPLRFFDLVDLWVFPDCSDIGLQDVIEHLDGRRVWGSRKGSIIEHTRRSFLELVEQVGLKAPKWEEVRGLTELKFHLENYPKGCYVKCSFWRGSCETHHHINAELSRTWFTHLEREMGPLVEEVPFIIIEPIDAVTEIGYDGYCVDGQFPVTSMQGIEGKDKTYIGTVTPWSDLPDQVREVNNAFADYLRSVNYRNRWSTEIRVSENGDFFFLDPTCRIPSPAGESQLANEENTGEIYWEGAVGNLVEPVYKSKFAVQVVIEHEDEMCEWRPVEVPDEIRDRVFLKYACKVDGRHWIPPQTHDEIVGWIVGLADTIQEAIGRVQEVADALEGQSLKISTESLADSLKAVEKQEEAGIEFTDQPVPEPSTVIDKT